MEERHDIHRHAALLGQPTRGRPPEDRHVDLLLGEIRDHFRRDRLMLALGPEGVGRIGMDPLANELQLAQAVGRRRPGDDADLLVLQPRVVEALEVRQLALARDQDIGRAVIRVGGLDDVAARRADDQVAQAGPEGVADESGPLGQPVIAQLDLQLVGDDLRDLVLEPAALALGERHVAGIAADTQDILRDEIRQVLRMSGPRPCRKQERGNRDRNGCA